MIDIVVYSCDMVLYTLMSCFGLFYTFGITWGLASGVSDFSSLVSFLANFPFLGGTTDFLPGFKF